MQGMFNYTILRSRVFFEQLHQFTHHYRRRDFLVGTYGLPHETEIKMRAGSQYCFQKLVAVIHPYGTIPDPEIISHQVKSRPMVHPGKVTVIQPQQTDDPKGNGTHG